MQKRQRVYAFVDESGQDDASAFFIVVAVVTDQDVDRLREALLDVEQRVRTGSMKWHKTRHGRPGAVHHSCA